MARTCGRVHLWAALALASLASASAYGGGKLIAGIQPKPEAKPPRLKERRVLRLMPVKQPPRLNGKLDDPCWQRAAVTGDLRIKSGTKFAKPFPKKTTLRAAYDDTTLYLAFECFDPQIDTLLAKYTARDDRYWLEDDIEFMIDPNYDRKSFYQFLFNAAGGRGDYLCWVEGRRISGDARYNPVWRLKTKVTKDRWVGEIALPFRSLGLESVAPGTRWGFNFCRIENPGTLLGNWTRAANHRDTRLFGDLVFGKAAFALGETDLGARARGVNLLRAAVTNNTSAAASLSLVVLVSAEGRTVGRSVSAKLVPAGQTRTLYVSYALPARAPAARVEIALEDAQWGKTVVRRVYDMALDPALEARMDSVEYFEKDREARVHVNISVGDTTATTGKLRARLFRRGQARPEMTDAVAPIPNGASVVRLNVAGLGVGAYELALDVLDADGVVLAEQRLPFSKSKSLMDF